MDHGDVEKFLRSVDPFHLLPEDALEEIVRALVVRRCRAKEIVFIEGGEGSAAYLVVTGRIAMFKSSPNGKELIVDLVAPGCFFGAVALMGNGPYPLTARAQLDSQLLVLDKIKFTPFLKRLPELQRSLIGVVTARMQATQNLARALAHDPVETRVASLLLSLLPRLGLNNRSEPPELHISRQEIADLTGMTLETASRVVKGLEREGVLDAARQGVLAIRDLDALRRLVAPL